MSLGRGGWLVSATALFLGWATLAFVTRIWAKLRNKSWGLDDSVISVAYAFGIAHVALICHAVQQGYGHYLDDIPGPSLRQVQIAHYAGRIMYMTCTGFCRISTALFITNLSATAPQIRPAYILAGVSGLWTAVAVLLVTVYPMDPDADQPWLIVDGIPALFNRWLGIEISGLVIELLLWALSLSIVWGLCMPVLRRIIILAAFGVRLLLIPLVVIRLIYLAPRQEDWTHDTILSAIITEAILHFSVLSACATSLRPFLRALRLEYAPSAASRTRPSAGLSTARSTATRSKNRTVLNSIRRTSAKDSYYKLDTINSTDSAEATRRQSKRLSGCLSEPPAVAYPPLVQPQKGEGQDKGSSNRAENDIENDHSQDGAAENELSDGTDRMVINLTMGWSIQYEEASRQ